MQHSARLTLVVAVFGVACTPQRTVPEAPRTLTFHAALEPPFSDSAVVAGQVTVLPDRLEIAVRRLEYYNRRGHGTPSPDSMKVALVSRDRLEIVSAAVPLVPSLRSENDPRPVVLLYLPRPAGHSLSRRSLSFIFPMNSTDADGNLIQGFYFAETDHDLFRAP